MTDRFFSCSICTRPSARTVGARGDICRRHFCLDDATYKRLIIDEIGRLRAQIDEKAVCRLASSLNDDKCCVIEHPSKAVGLDSLTGCANYHARIRFSDGSPSWLM
ncbi:uncharacterized protein LY79DRAFT_591713 [Colletotrichum navitas]|uniref:Uncharacterized protein n=1 Tax=Colletotrichum navitas TaxID=681940 RepID=A0AAD8PUP1_9PEZI|nr:uncharacterized protein LY79DRAFT_591713 [Colletotrichum navitas]KAK1585005.1 hypothetical protein LY79DRAFT_591713 [Colletotrichum navitas]